MRYLYTDGSSRGNPGDGGYAVVEMETNIENSKAQPISLQYGYEENVTNNQMELTAILKALEKANENPNENYTIYCDSAYCVNMCNDWIYKWKSANWKRPKNQEIKNLDLVQQIFNQLNVDFPNFIIVKVHGHSNVAGNEWADAFASRNGKKIDKLIQESKMERSAENDLHLR